jgi:hypothetical protein
MEHAADAPAWALALQEGPIGLMMRHSPLLYPLVEIGHILGFVLLVGSIVAFDLRVLGLARALPLAPMARFLPRIAIVGFCIAAPAGFLLLSADAASVVRNPAFQFKLALILAAGANAVAFHRVAGKGLDTWPVDAPAPAAARAAALASMVLWLSAVAAGRLIAYV